MTDFNKILDKAKEIEEKIMDSQEKIKQNDETPHQHSNTCVKAGGFREKRLQKSSKMKK